MMKIKKNFWFILLSILIMQTFLFVPLRADQAQSTSRPENNVLFPVEYKGKYGFIDSQGNLVVKIIYDYAEAYPEVNRYVVEENEEFILFNSKSEELYRDKAMIVPFSEKIVALRTYDSFPAGELINIKNKQKVLKFNAVDFLRYNDLFLILHEGETYGLYDLYGNLKKIISLSGVTFPEDNSGLMGAKRNGKWGYMDIEGNWIIEPQWDFAAGFSEGFGFVSEKEVDFFVDKTGKQLGNNKFSSGHSFSEGIAGVSPIDSELWGYIDRKGEYIIKPQFIFVEPFSEGFAAVYTKRYSEDKKYGSGGYINHNGEFQIKLKNINQLLPFENGLAFVRAKEKEGYINKKGEWVWVNNDKDWLEGRGWKKSLFKNPFVLSGAGIGSIIILSYFFVTRKRAANKLGSSLEKT